MDYTALDGSFLIYVILGVEKEQRCDAKEYKYPFLARNGSYSCLPLQTIIEPEMQTYNLLQRQGEQGKQKIGYHYFAFVLFGIQSFYL